MISYPDYPAYKPSGIEWLGDIPTHWNLRRIKSVVRNAFNGVWGDEPKNDDNDLICIRVADFDYENLQVSSDNLTIRNIPPTMQPNRLLQKEDLLIEKSGGGDIWPVGRVISYNIHHKAVSSNFIARLITNSEVVSRFLCYVFSAAYAVGLNTCSIKQTTGIQNLDLYSYLIEKFGLPPLSEQHAIAAFLDRETTHIDSLIAKKRELIDLLSQQRTAIISHAVTKGLNPNALMKPSGVEWLGDVPEHWEIRKLKFEVSFYGGGTPSKNNLEYWQGDIPWVSPKDMKTEFVVDAEDHITKAAIVESSTKLIDEGAVLLVVRSGILKHTIPVAMNTVKVALNQDMKALVSKGTLLPEFLALLIRGNQQQLLFEWRKAGATVESIEFELLANTRIPIPPRNEQAGIIEAMKKEIGQMDLQAKYIQESIDLLEKQRVALISAAVTGKIDVREHGM